MLLKRENARVAALRAGTALSCCRGAVPAGSRSVRKGIAGDDDGAQGCNTCFREEKCARAERRPASTLLQIGMPPRLLTPEQAAAYCGMSLNHWNTHLRARLSLIPFGRRMLVDRKRLDELLDQLSNITALSSPAEDLLAARLCAAAPRAAAIKPKVNRS